MIRQLILGNEMECAILKVPVVKQWNYLRRIFCFILCFGDHLPTCRRPDCFFFFNKPLWSCIKWEVCIVSVLAGLHVSTRVGHRQQEEQTVWRRDLHKKFIRNDYFSHFLKCTLTESDSCVIILSYLNEIWNNKNIKNWWKCIRPTTRSSHGDIRLLCYTFIQIASLLLSVVHR